VSRGLILLAGGRSSRMGTNKLLLELAGEQVIGKIKKEMSSMFSHCLLVANEEEPYRSLAVPIVSDVYPGKGPLAGIHAGLSASDAKVNFVVAGDMPFASPELADYLLTELGEHDALIPMVKGQAHPLFAVYTKNCIQPFAACLEEGQLKVVNGLQQVHASYLELSQAPLPIDLEKALFNMNAPEDYLQACKFIK
jgi:molybdopterin-guanine dinucleotide biosynthesis protein A